MFALSVQVDLFGDDGRYNLQCALRAHGYRTGMRGYAQIYPMYQISSSHSGYARSSQIIGNGVDVAYPAQVPQPIWTRLEEAKTYTDCTRQLSSQQII